MARNTLISNHFICQFLNKNYLHRSEISEGFSIKDWITRSNIWCLHWQLRNEKIILFWGLLAIFISQKLGNLKRSVQFERHITFPSTLRTHSPPIKLQIVYLLRNRWIAFSNYSPGLILILFSFLPTVSVDSLGVIPNVLKHTSVNMKISLSST